MSLSFADLRKINEAKPQTFGQLLKRLLESQQPPRPVVATQATARPAIVDAFTAILAQPSPSYRLNETLPASTRAAGRLTEADSLSAIL